MGELTHMRKSNVLTDVENKLMVTGGVGGSSGGRILGDWD